MVSLIIRTPGRVLKFIVSDTPVLSPVEQPSTILNPRSRLSEQCLCTPLRWSSGG
jgi:hypothetical protein